MIKIGITGGLGAGKSTVCKLFKSLGVPIFNSDICARDAEKEPFIQQEFKRVLGDDIMVDGIVDRAKMRGIIFVDKAKLTEINNIILPYIKMKFNQFSLNNNAPYVLLESAILFETNATSGFDHIITVTADTDVRIARALQRDPSTNLEEIKNKLNNQLSEEIKIAKADFIIFNNGTDLLDSADMLTKQVKTIHKAICLDLVLNGLQELNNQLKTHNNG